MFDRAEMRMLRRRLNLKLLFVVGIVFILFLFLITLAQFNNIESSSYSKRVAKKTQDDEAHNKVNIDSEVDRLRRIENLKLRVANKFQNRFNDMYDNELEAIVDADFAQSVAQMDRFVHLDLKGAQPKLNYLKEFIPYAKKLGATGLLVEYEDFFPFINDLEAIKNQNHYTKQELNLLFDIIKENNLKIIPLIQTYGHLEFVLKLKQFAHLREAKQHYQVISPCLNETYDGVLFKMIDQIIDAHPKDLEFIHIGCDEVYHINKNPACSSMESLKTTQDFFIQYEFIHFLLIVLLYF